MNTNNELKKMLEETLSTMFGKTVNEANNEELYISILQLTKMFSKEQLRITGDKKVYYISAEFLIGKLLSNNLINLGLYDELNNILKDSGKNLSDIEEVELEPSLGNGGLGRLAACFLDSIASLQLPGDGCGLNYHLGLFKQKFDNKLQRTEKNEWITENSWLEETGKKYDVNFGYGKVTGILKDIDVPGYNGGKNKLHLFDIATVDENIVGDGINFPQWDINKNLTLFLYPDDSTKQGELLRVYQQYFMVSCSAQMILEELKEKNVDLHNMDKHACIQINDTHPSMVIPELIRLLIENENFSMDEAIELVSKTTAYTNHTILAEALEKWPIEYIETVAPQIMPIIYELDKRIKQKFGDNEKINIINNGRVHMAHMDVHYGYSVNGVAALHTEILKNSELNEFYKLYPEKFNNKTNGITFRRWLLASNKELAELIEKTIGPDFKKNSKELEKLGDHYNNEEFLNKLKDIKHIKKIQLSDYLETTQGIKLNSNSIFDIQTKRLHEYKRQQLNLLYIINKYQEIKAGKIPSTPLTFIFGAKAAPAYTTAKDIIHAILTLQELVQNDREVSKHMKIVMLENYNVTLAEKVIPACDISEQISLASKEASGTGNMKFMLNGGITLGTDDGANVEIHDLVGDDNIYIFGEKADTVIQLYKDGNYNPEYYYENDENIKKAVDFLISYEMIQLAHGHYEHLERLRNELLHNDYFKTFLDFDDYKKTKDRAFADYENDSEWKRKMLVNIQKSGFFSSDRTIEDYNKDIWKLK